ncbi:MAG: CRISPR-associated endoribonuclease Cas6 [Anaerolineae bacterium]
MSLLSIVFTLRPRQHGVLPFDQGRALAAEFLNWVRARDAALSAALHEENEIRPYTVSSLRGSAGGGGQILLLPERPLWWRLTTLTPELSAFVQAHLLPALPDSITLGEQTFDLLSATCDPQKHPWAGQSSCEEIAAGKLLAPQAAASFTLEFATPTTFHSDGRFQPFPLPGLVFRQWLEKWNAFSPLRFPSETLGMAESLLVVSRYRLESKVVKYGQAAHIGFTGRCTYRLRSNDPYWRRILQALADFAFFCGTGAKTTFGLGQTRPVAR